MGIGKSTLCKELNKELENSIYLDGDWCWNMNPFVVNEETKQMVLSNIVYLLNSYIHCSIFDNIIFCWVMHETSIIENLLKALDVHDTRVKTISLICSEDELVNRMNLDGRDLTSIKRSLNYLPKYEQLDTVKVNVSGLSVKETVDKIKMIGQGD